jgi:hypothetical protein
MAQGGGDLPGLEKATNSRCSSVAPSKVNIGACPPATTIASNAAADSSATGRVTSTSAASFCVERKPSEIRSVFE